jgi:DNA-binding response OmpR family regulator
MAAHTKAAEGKPDLLLLGLEIVEEQGAAVLHEIASKWPAAKIMLVAAQGQDTLAQTYLPDGAHSVLTMPLTVQSVRRKVDVMFGQGTNAIVQLSILPAMAG